MPLASALGSYLEELGCTHVFGVSGANIEPLFYALHLNRTITPVLAKHEANAVTMAEGYFRKTGKPGIVIMTSGGGAFNTLAPLTEALASAIPLLVIAGQIPCHQEGRGGFQDSSGNGTRIDAEAIFRPVCLQVHKLRHAQSLGWVLDDLLSTALGQGGPAVLLVPRNLFQTVLCSAPGPRLKTPDQTLPPDRLLSQAQALLGLSKQSLVIAGEEVLHRNYRAQLQEFVEWAGASIALTADGKGLWDHQAPEFVGLVGAMGHESAHRAIAAADLVLAIGTRLPLVSRPPAEALVNKTVVSLHGSPSLLRPEDAAGLTVIDLVGSTAATLFALSQKHSAVSGVSFPGVRHPLARPTSPEFIEPPPHRMYRAREDISMRVAIECLASEISPDTDLFVDAGNTGAAAIHYFSHRGRSLFSVALGMGAMGHSFGCAIGATFAGRNRSMVVAGDGAFFMHGLEIHTAWQHRLPITFVLFNNNAHAMCHLRESLYFGSPSGDNLFRPSQLGQGMAAMFPELPSFDIHSEGALRDRLRMLRTHEGPALLSIETSPEEMPPFQPFLNPK
jgi:acetolactate synthase-1/2/3 large subunit